MFPPVSPIHFSATIRVVPKEEFERLDVEGMKAQGLTSEKPWSLKNIVSLKPKAATQGAYICNAGGITNGQRVSLFHLCPYDELWDPLKSDAYYETWENISKKLKEDIAALKRENPDIRAFFTGGVGHKPDSARLGGAIFRFFREMGIPTTILWGSRGWEDIHYDAPSDTWTLHASSMPLSPEALQQRFSKVHIADGDTLVINGEEINPAEVNTP